MIKVYTWYIPGIYQEKHFKGFQMPVSMYQYVPVQLETRFIQKTLFLYNRSGFQMLGSKAPQHSWPAAAVQNHDGVPIFGWMIDSS